MNNIDGTGFQTEFHQAPTLASFAAGSGHLSRIAGHVPLLSLTNNDMLTVYDFDTIVIDGGRLTAFGSGTVYARGNAHVRAHDKVRVIAFDEASGELYGHSSGTFSDHSSAVGYERARLTFHDLSSGILQDFAVGSFHNFSTGTVHDQANANAYGSATIDIHGDHSSVRARQKSKVVIHGTPAVWLADEAVAHLPEGAKEKFIVKTGNAKLVRTPIVRADDSLTPSATPTQGYQLGGSPTEDWATIQTPEAANLPTVPAIEEAAPTPELSIENTTFPATPVESELPDQVNAKDEPEPASATASGVPLADFGPTWFPLRPSA
ncbi:hypothetical protein [Rhodococcus qingshengii]|uniref:hypothetical protein n=1 Tax=Rhodococcus qingshengii TaxID=334542 RepID=UPI00287F898B|nr:hypothetical protein [Rhodococcus qingshengii]